VKYTGRPQSSPLPDVSSEILPNLEAGLALMKTEPERFKPHSASNGWGTYEQAVPWLEDFIEQIKEYPDGVIGISR
jgi:hypothetical protein